MDAVQQRFLRALHSKVCRNCSNLSENQVCGLVRPVCPVGTNLREIVPIAQYVCTDSPQPYVQELRSSFCAGCGGAASSCPSQCPAREVIDCPLDRYLTLVFQAIDEVHEEIRSEAEAVIH